LRGISRRKVPEELEELVVLLERRHRWRDEKRVQKGTKITLMEKERRSGRGALLTALTQ